MPNIPKVYNFALVLVGIAYPFIVYFGLQYFPPYIIGCLLVLIIVLRLLTGQAGHKARHEIIVLGVSLVLVLVLLPLNDQLAIKIYPVTINFGLALAFIYSMLQPPNIIERFARLIQPDLNERGVKYTQKVAAIWIAFFILNGSVSSWTALYADMELWTLYNGFISYVMMGVLFAGEMIVRQFVKQNHVGEI